MNDLDIYPGALPKTILTFTISGVTDDGDTAKKVADDEAEYFSVYAIEADGTETCIADLPYKEVAADLWELLEYVQNRSRLYPSPASQADVHKRPLSPYDRELAEYQRRQAEKTIAFERSEQERIAELTRKAAGYDAIMAAENGKPWGATELVGMMHFANGFVKGWADRPADESLEDHWVTFSDDVDIQFWTYDPDDKEHGSDRAIHATGYRRPIVNGNQRCEGEVRLI